MKWPPGKRSPAPSGQDGHGAKISLKRTENSRSSHRVQDRRARAWVFAEFGYRHGSALDHDGFEDRKPWQAPKPSPELRLLSERVLR